MQFVPEIADAAQRLVVFQRTGNWFLPRKNRRYPWIMREAIRRLKAIGRERGFRLVPGHDPDVWPAFTHEMGVPGP